MQHTDNPIRLIQSLSQDLIGQTEWRTLSALEAASEQTANLAATRIKAPVSGE